MKGLGPAILEESADKTEQPTRSTRVRLLRATRLEPRSQTWVQVRCNYDGLVTIVTNPKLTASLQCPVASGVAMVEANKPFKILIANFDDKPAHLCVNQIIASYEVAPTFLEESGFSHAEILGIVPEDRSRMFRKQNASARDVHVINKHLAEKRSQVTEAEDKPVTVDDIELEVSLEKETAVRDMLRRHEPMWTGALGEIRTSEMRIDLVDNARPFRSPPYRAGPKTRELEQAEVD